MRAAYITAYGSADQIDVRDVPRPEPKEDEVLVRNRASSVNFGNAAHVRGKPWPIRAFTGMVRPKAHIPGGDVAGIVEAVGRRVAEFKPGDEVMGDSADSGFGAYAEYVAVPARALVTKPAGLSFEETAALPLACAVAVAGLRDKGRVRAGQKALIVGSTGSVGPFAVQVAKTAGAVVTAVTSGRHADFVRSLGADHVIDYERDDPTAQGRRYDLVVGIAGARPMTDFRKVLTPTGIYVNIGGGMRQFRSVLLSGPFLSTISRQKYLLLMYKADRATLEAVRDLAEAGTVRPAIDKIYPLERVADAFRFYEGGHPAGKIVITIP